MNEDERLYEQYEDAFFALLMNRVAEANGKELMQKNEELLADPNAAIPESLNKRCLQILEKNQRKVQRQKAARKAVRTLNRVALWILIPIFLFDGAFSVSAAVREKTMSFLVEKFDIGTQFYIQNGDGLPANNEDEAANSCEIITACVPGDYNLSLNMATTTVNKYLFKNSSGSELLISEYSLENAEGTVAIDTEDAEEWDETTEQQKIMYVRKNDVIQAVWTDDFNNKMLVVRGTKTDLDTVREVIKNIILVLR